LSIQTELYVYWHVAADECAQALADTALMQRQLCEMHPALRARLLQKAPNEGSSASPSLSLSRTLMEIYAHPEGIGPELLASIADVAGKHLDSYRRADDPRLGARHLEHFVAIQQHADADRST